MRKKILEGVTPMPQQKVATRETKQEELFEQIMSGEVEVLLFINDTELNLFRLFFSEPLLL